MTVVIFLLNIGIIWTKTYNFYSMCLPVASKTASTRPLKAFRDLLTSAGPMDLSKALIEHFRAARLVLCVEQASPYLSPTFPCIATSHSCCSS